jgi:hypothetical protein
MKRKNIIQEIENLAYELLDKYNLDDWEFKWSNASRRFGSCNRNNKTIYLSRLHGLYDDIYLVKDTLLHEIAHGLTPKNHSSHGVEWKEIAQKIGCNPVSYKKSNIPEKYSCKYIGICENCNNKVYLNKRGKYFCRNCYNNFSSNYKFNYFKNTDYLGDNK